MSSRRIISSERRRAKRIYLNWNLGLAFTLLLCERGRRELHRRCVRDGRLLRKVLDAVDHLVGQDVRCDRQRGCIPRGSTAQPSTTKAPDVQDFLQMELVGLEPTTSWVRFGCSESPYRLKICLFAGTSHRPGTRLPRGIALG
jgi:hypothetical protein